MLFNLANVSLVIVVTVICFVIFSLFYALVYKNTSGAYYAIVSGRRGSDYILESSPLSSAWKLALSV